MNMLNTKLFTHIHSQSFFILVTALLGIDKMSVFKIVLLVNMLAKYWVTDIQVMEDNQVLN